MASLEKRGDTYRVVFWFANQKYSKSLKTSKKSDAETRLLNLEETIRLVECGRLQIPDDADLVTFLLSDGKLQQQRTKQRDPKPVTLKSLFDDFFDSIPADNLEGTTEYGMKIHKKHLIRLFGARYPVGTLDLEDLQNYVNKRAKEKTRWGSAISATTIAKELTTFSTVWRWGAKTKRIKGEYPRDGIRLPKTEELPPFQTWNEIERQIEQNGLEPDEAKQLWESLYLRASEIDALLADVHKHAQYPFIYPMVFTPAHTGARRSELLRSLRTDFNFDAGVVTIREKKRKRGKLTTRRVPLSDRLSKVIRDWFDAHPGGIHSFVHPGSMPRSNAKTNTPLTPNQASNHFANTLKDTRWEPIKGWHCLRHSFISNLACNGVDQRIIDEFVGHMTEAMRRRYRHLFPDVKKAAIDGVFGSINDAA